MTGRFFQRPRAEAGRQAARPRVGMRAEGKGAREIYLNKKVPGLVKDKGSMEHWAGHTPARGDPGRGQPVGKHLWFSAPDTEWTAGCRELKMWESSQIRSQPGDFHLGDIFPDSNGLILTDSLKFCCKSRAFKAQFLTPKWASFKPRSPCRLRCCKRALGTFCPF